MTILDNLIEKGYGTPMQERTLILIRGLSGSGKTTLANIICQANPKYFSISVDDFFTLDGEYEFNAPQLQEAHEWCKLNVETAMTQKMETIVVHNTFSRRWEIEPYQELALSHDYNVCIINLYDAGLNDVQLSKRSPHQISVTNVRAQRTRWEPDPYRDIKRKRFYPRHEPQRDTRFKSLHPYRH